MLYIIIGNSDFDYEISNIIFGVFTDKKQAEYQKKQLENLQAKNGANEMSLYIEEVKMNSLDDENIKHYLYL